jgi:hypothetical protein
MGRPDVYDLRRAGAGDSDGAVNFRGECLSCDTHRLRQQGRVLVSTNSYRGTITGRPLVRTSTISGTRYTYDAEDRAVFTEQIRDFIIAFDLLSCWWMKTGGGRGVTLRPLPGFRFAPKALSMQSINLHLEQIVPK